MATTPELLAQLREELDDEASPYGWSSLFLVRALTQAERQACRRAFLITDKDTASVCHVSVSASVQVYALHSKILRIRRIALASRMEYPLDGPFDRFYFDQCYPGWMSAYALPVAYLTELKSRGVMELLFNANPLSATMASLIVARLPLQDLSEASTSIPEIDETYHFDLLIWAKKLAFEKNDSDTFSPVLAKKYEDEFTVKFGPLPSAEDERKRRLNSMYPRARTREFGF